MRYIGIDFGTKRTGVALSDEQGTIAFPHSVIATRKAIAEDLLLLAEKEHAEIFVLGKSITGAGLENPVMTQVHALAKALAKEFKVVFEDERYSSQHASRVGEENDMHDASTAAIILQSYLDRKNHKPLANDPYALLKP